MESKGWIFTVNPQIVIDENLSADKRKDLMDFYYGKPRTIKVCIVTEFPQENYFQWFIALNKFSNSEHRYGGWFEISNERGHSIILSSIELNPATIQIYPENHSYWNPIREADVVFVYCARQDMKWEWYKAPVIVKKWMKSNAKMVCQFDDELMWLWNPDHSWWDKEDDVSWSKGKKPEKFLKETHILEVADAYFSVLDNPPWKLFTNKPVYYMPLPQIARYNKDMVVPNMATMEESYMLQSASFIFLKEVETKHKSIVTLHHSIRTTTIKNIIDNVLSKIDVPVIYFTSRMENKDDIKIDNLSPHSTIFTKMKRNGYMFSLRKAYIAINNNEGYIGWSRFAYECAISCIPCVGSTEAVKHLFPDLYTKPEDYERQRRLLERLLLDKDFYELNKYSGWIKAIQELSDANLVTKFLKIVMCDLKYIEKNKSVGMKFFNLFKRHSNIVEQKRIKVEEKEQIKLVKEAEIRLLVCTPFCNEEHSLPKYIESLLALDYPKELIDLIWVENNSSDNTWELLQKHHDNIIKDYNYHSFTLLQKSCEHYTKIEKQGLEEYGKTGYGGKFGKANSFETRRYRPAHQISIWNYMLEQMTDEHNYILFIFADVVISPDIIQKFIADMQAYPDAGWFGGIMHRRYPRHKRMEGQNPMHYGLASPYIKVLTKTENEMYVIRHPAYPYGVHGLTEEELIQLQKDGKFVFEICCSGHVFMIRREIVKNGLKFILAPIETGLAVERSLNSMGYKMYCDSNVYIQHISIDGKIYRHSLRELLQEQKEILEEIKENKTSELTNEDEDREEVMFVEFFIKIIRKGIFNIPQRPVEKSKIFDRISKKIIDSEDWDILYGKWRRIMDNPELYEKLRKKAKELSKRR